MTGNLWLNKSGILLAPIVDYDVGEVVSLAAHFAHPAGTPGS